MTTDYKDDLKIDIQKLEICLRDQPELRHKWHVQGASANREKRLAKQRLDIVKSQLAAKARGADWDLLGFPKKPTDQMVKDWIPQQQEHIDAELEYIEACYDAEILSGTKDDFDDRRASLTNLVKLYLNAYYADESLVGKEARDLLKDFDKQATIEQLNETDQITKLKRRKKGGK